MATGRHDYAPCRVGTAETLAAACDRAARYAWLLTVAKLFRREPLRFVLHGDHFAAGPYGDRFIVFCRPQRGRVEHAIFDNAEAAARHLFAAMPQRRAWELPEPCGSRKQGHHGM